MFSSNQVLQISGCIEHRDELKHALDFAIKASGWYDAFTRKDKPAKCTFQITKDGRYCLGWGVKEGWTEFQFDFDIDIISKIVAQHLEKQELDRGFWDGSYSKGFLIKNLEFTFDDEKDGVKNPSYGIIQIEPYTCFYAK